MNQERRLLKISDMLKQKKDPEPPEEEAGGPISVLLTQTSSEVNENLCTYLSLAPTVDYKSEQKLEELHQLIK